MAIDSTGIFVSVEGECALDAGDLAASGIEPTFEAVVAALKENGGASRILLEWNLPYKIVVYDRKGRSETVAEQT
jgi:hypothetical protein